MNTQDAIKSGVELSPSVAYAGLHLFGVSMPDWAALLAAIYTIVQLARLVWKWRGEHQANKAGS